jgi:DNA polymerase III delta prime subunit
VEWNLNGLLSVAEDAVSVAESAASRVINRLSGNKYGTCPFVDEPAENARVELRKRLVSQDRAVEHIVSALRQWEFALHSDESGKDGSSPGTGVNHAKNKRDWLSWGGKPDSKNTIRSSARAKSLVLAVTGPTGVGKTETANILSKALLKDALASSNSHGYRTINQAKGVLFFHGEDYSGAEFFDDENARLGRVREYRLSLHNAFISHLQNCGGHAVVVIDEVQKMLPGVLEVFKTAMDEAFISVPDSPRLDCSRVVFILVSDIGAKEMMDVIVGNPQYGGDREVIPSTLFRKVVKNALDRQWDRLQIGAVIDEVVPFLPLEQRHIVKIIRSKLTFLDTENRGVFWSRFHFTETLVNQMSSEQYIAYATATTEATKSTGISLRVAKHGARNVENGGPIALLRARLYATIRRQKFWPAMYPVEVDFILATEGAASYFRQLAFFLLFCL